MAEQTPLSVTIDAFTSARGEEMDGVWAYGVSWRLLRRDVQPDQVREGLEEALALLRQTQESPQELFGSPDEHADALYDRWAEEGRLHLWDASSMSWAEVPAWGFGLGAFFSIAFLGVFLAHGETSRTWTLGMIVVPVGMGLAMAAAWAAWSTLLRSRGVAAALAGFVGTAAGLAMTIALVNEWSKAHPLGTATTWWYVWVAAASALLAAALGRWRESRPETAPQGIVDVDDWSRQLAAILRGRHTLSDARVRTIVGDAHAHAADAGRTVQEEFGTPEEYAARFAPDLPRRSRLMIAFYLTMAVLWLVPLTWGFSWLKLAAGVGWLLIALREHRRYGDLLGTEH
ncbi:hypothetical protein ASC64_00200 [Nocardioides sp. Root122]|uniref:hypothetical protein n=1 Tax=Nocardioides TaxID=1839 RepID=UPI000703274D|nr:MULTISPECIES: hypothetical protein [Nocardioides]KQV77318.1 hypothetical protein ASC64_00200 [Nocardioides sp. Root122]MCK9825465.1 hypothetical protein [Nocardioides cavernae]